MATHFTGEKSKRPIFEIPSHGLSKFCITTINSKVSIIVNMVGEMSPLERTYFIGTLGQCLGASKLLKLGAIQASPKKNKLHKKKKATKKPTTSDSTSTPCAPQLGKKTLLPFWPTALLSKDSSIKVSEASVPVTESVTAMEAEPFSFFTSVPSPPLCATVASAPTTANVVVKAAIDTVVAATSLNPFAAPFMRTNPTTGGISTVSATATAHMPMYSFRAPQPLLAKSNAPLLRGVPKTGSVATFTLQSSAATPVSPQPKRTSQLHSSVITPTMAAPITRFAKANVGRKERVIDGSATRDVSSCDSNASSCDGDDGEHSTCSEYDGGHCKGCSHRVHRPRAGGRRFAFMGDRRQLCATAAAVIAMVERGQRRRVRSAKLELVAA